MMQDFNIKRVDKTQIANTNISTVFLGYNHGSSDEQLFFETMIFSDIKEIDEDVFRYTTWKEAELGHLRAVNM